jgi:hypothetical protein
MSQRPELIVQCRRCGNIWRQPTPPLDACGECGAGPDEHRRAGPISPSARRTLDDPRIADRR